MSKCEHPDEALFFDGYECSNYEIFMASPIDYLLFWVGIISIPLVMYGLYRWYGLTIKLTIKVMIKDILQRREDRIIRLTKKLYYGDEE